MGSQVRCGEVKEGLKTLCIMIPAKWVLTLVHEFET